MKWKRKVTAAVLIPLAYLAYLATDLKQGAEPAAQAHLDAPSLPQPEMKTVSAPRAPVALARVVKKTKAHRSAELKRRQQSELDGAQARSDATEAESAKKASLVIVPRPSNADFTLVKLREVRTNEPCPIDRSCQPEGRQGVLLVGTSLSLQGWQPKFGSAWHKGSYKDQTALLVYQ